MYSKEMNIAFIFLFSINIKKNNQKKEQFFDFYFDIQMSHDMITITN
jgi:hypothetical protein